MQTIETPSRSTGDEGRTMPEAIAVLCPSWIRWTLFAGFVLGCGVLVEAQPPSAGKGSATDANADRSSSTEEARPAESDRTAAPSNKSRLRQREGAKLIDHRGRFERRGDRYVFLAENDAVHFIVLENLMLDRVGTVLGESAGGQLSWNVSGTITEFRGTNYLLLQRAVVKSASGPREPKRLEGSTAARPVTDAGTKR